MRATSTLNVNFTLCPRHASHNSRTLILGTVSMTFITMANNFSLSSIHQKVTCTRKLIGAWMNLIQCLEECLAATETHWQMTETHWQMTETHWQTTETHWQMPLEWQGMTVLGNGTEYPGSTKGRKR